MSLILPIMTLIPHLSTSYPPYHDYRNDYHDYTVMITTITKIIMMIIMITVMINMIIMMILANFSQPLLSHKSALVTSDDEGNLETLSVLTATTNNINKIIQHH